MAIALPKSPIAETGEALDQVNLDDDASRVLVALTHAAKSDQVNSGVIVEIAR